MSLRKKKQSFVAISHNLSFHIFLWKFIILIKNVCGSFGTFSRSAMATIFTVCEYETCQWLYSIGEMLLFLHTQGRKMA